MENNHLCEYGCGQQAKFLMKNGKWCCESFYTKCPEQRRKNKELNKKGKLAIPFENVKKLLCDYGCGKIAKFKYPSSKKICCEKNDNFCPSKKKKISLANKGKIRSEQFKIKVSLDKKGKPSGMLGKKQTEYCKKVNSERLKNGEAERLNQFPRDPIKIKICAEKSRQRLLNGGAKYMHSFPCMGYKTHTEWMKETKGRYLKSFITKISKDETKLRNLIKEIYPDCKFQFPILNFDLDIALPEYKIAIEFDGYFHFDTEEHKEYHKQRQEKIENEGWKFYRVTMFDKFPDSNAVKEKIEGLINETRNQR